LGKVRTSHLPNAESPSLVNFLILLQGLIFNTLIAELNSICYLLALLGVHHLLHVSRIRVKSLTLRQFSSSEACGRSPTEIVGSNPTGGMDICLL